MSAAALQCQCAAGYEGQRCETNTDDCVGVNCNQGVCKDLVSSFECACKPGYTGATCNQASNPCDSIQCVNGQCQNVNGVAKCTCAAGWEGELCDLNINDCLDDPCGDHGSCFDGVDTFLCVCKDGYSGDRCTVAQVSLADVIFYLPLRYDILAQGAAEAQIDIGQELSRALAVDKDAVSNIRLSRAVDGTTMVQAAIPAARVNRMQSLLVEGDLIILRTLATVTPLSRTTTTPQSRGVPTTTVADVGDAAASSSKSNGGSLVLIIAICATVVVVALIVVIVLKRKSNSGVATVPVVGAVPPAYDSGDNFQVRNLAFETKAVDEVDGFEA